MTTAGHSAHAHGKVILLGEHAVVYGYPALAAALEAGVTVRIVPGNGTLHVPVWDAHFSLTDSAGPPLAVAARALHDALELPVATDVDFIADFAIPTGAGLGSSGALAIALARVLSAMHHKNFSSAQLKSAAMASETVIHGKPSGLDHTVACDGGFGLFTRANGLAAVAAPALTLVVGHTGRARDTKGRVARIAELLQSDRVATEAHFTAIDALVRRAKSAIEVGDLATLGVAMNDNEKHLAALEVSCPEIETMREIALANGALGAKLTGGGGGGCVIAIAPGNEDAVTTAWRKHGYATFVTKVGGANAEVSAAPATPRTMPSAVRV